MTVYLSFGHDYMLHYATISETTPELLQSWAAGFCLAPSLV